MPPAFIGSLIRGTVKLALILFGIASLAILVLLFVAPASLLNPVASALIVSEEPKHGDAIVVLLGSDAPDRVVTAEELFRNGVSDRIIVGSGFMLPSWFEGLEKPVVWQHPALRMKVALESLGVPQDKITIVDTSLAYDTSAELTEIAAYLRAKKLSHVILVSSATHTRRMQIIWRRIAPDLEASVVAADSSEMKAWWTDSRLIRNVGYEYAALIKELLRQIRSRAVTDPLKSAPPAEVPASVLTGELAH